MRRIIRLLLLLGAILLVAWGMPIPPSLKAFSNFLVLHTLMETVSIVIAMMVFAVGWNSHSGKTSGNQVLLASIFFAVGCLDFFHTVTFVGMPDFVTFNDPDKHLHFWMSARFMAVMSLLIVSLRPWRQMVGSAAKYWIFSALLLFTCALNWGVIYHHGLLPTWFVPGAGLTPLKKSLEYAFIAINGVTAVLLWRKLHRPQLFNVALLFGSVCTMAMGEFFFTLYTTPTGIYNVLGHTYKVISYLLIYRALVVEAIEQPYKDLELSQENLELAVEASNTGLWSWNIGTDEMHFSDVWKAQLGYGPNELEESASAWRALVHPDDLQAGEQRIASVLPDASQPLYENEFRMRHKNGSYRWILSRGKVLRDGKGVAYRLIGSHADVTERKRAETRFRGAVEASANAMLLVDREDTIVMTNHQAEKEFGFDGNTLVGKPFEQLVAPLCRASYRLHMQGVASASAGVVMGADSELYLLDKGGRSFRAELGLSPVDSDDGPYVLASVVDITQRIEAQERIEKLVNYDVLTGLPNRRLLQDRVEQAMRAADLERKRLAILFLDLDNFKNVNDTLGHSIGDKLLVEIGSRLQSQVRESDTVARVGGDEFILLLNDVDVDGVVRVASKILSAIVKPYALRSYELAVTPSIGVAMYPDDGASFEELHQHADTAMYRAKHEGKNDYRFFTNEMQLHSMRNLRLENAMHRALERGQFHLVYQPQLTVDGRRILGVEALLRWVHPELGNVSPAEFIPLAEANGQIVPIGRWVINTAVEQLRRWMDAGLAPMVMAVNISAVQFRNTNLPSMLAQVLREWTVPAAYLELELTEGIAMDDPQGAIAMMNDIHELGIQMSIDDFGTGYSSLSALKKFNIYKIKIDQSFVRDIATDADDRAIVKAIIQMANSLGFKTIAEGVETDAQLDFLKEQGCEEVQGYLFSKPLVAAELETFVRRLI